MLLVSPAVIIIIIIIVRVHVRLSPGAVHSVTVHSVTVGQLRQQLLHRVRVESDVIRLLSSDHLRHEPDVGDGDAQRLDSRQLLLVGKRRHLSAQFVERLVQVEHPLPFPYVGRPTLCDGRGATALQPETILSIRIALGI